jgi:predicted ribosome quality control (RQC) complex YloA/Tae2 family protein
MLSNYYTLSYVVSDLGARIQGLRTAALFTQEKDELLISFRDFLPTLVITCRPSTNTIYLHPGIARAKRNSTDLLIAARHRPITSVSVLPNERIVHIGLNEGFFLAAHFFGSAGNVFLVDERGNIVDAFKHPRQLVGKPLPDEPSGIADPDLLPKTVAHSPSLPVATAVRRALPTFAGTLAAEAAVRSGLDPSLACGTLGEDGTATLLRAVRAILAELANPSPRLYARDNGMPVYFSLIPLKLAAHLREEIIPDVHQAIRTMIARTVSAAEVTETRGRLASTLTQRLSRLRRSLEGVDRDAGNRSRAAEYEHFGALLLSHLHEFSRGDNAATIAEGKDLFNIPLDTALTPSRNAQRYFEKAKHARTALREADRRRNSFRNSSRPAAGCSPASKR